MIRVESLTRRYGDFTAVNNVSFTIGRGEVVGLLGHNGAGKTTIMKMLTGYLEPTEGMIQVDDLIIGKDTRAIQARIGYLPENCPVWPEMTVIDYLDYQATLHGVPEPQRLDAVRQAIRRTALSDKATAPIQTLSRGYRQRVGVAQALLHKPDILILDEPTNGLDPTQILQMRELIRDLSQHATVIVSTHIMQEVQAVCERVLIMRAGHLVVDSRVDDLGRDGRLLVSVGEDVSELISAFGDIEHHAANDGVWHYRLKAAASVAPELAQTLVARGVALHQLRAEKRDLESVFAEVNASDVRSKEVVHA